MNSVTSYFSDPSIWGATVSWVATDLALAAICHISGESRYYSWPTYLSVIEGAHCIAYLGAKQVFRCLEARKWGERGLAQWVEEATGTPEHTNRITASQLIRLCFEKKYTVLNLSSLLLTSLPPEIGHLTHLETLLLDENLFTSFPFEIGRLANLRLLDLRDNQLTSSHLDVFTLPSTCTIFGSFSESINEKIRRRMIAHGYQGPQFPDLEIPQLGQTRSSPRRRGPSTDTWPEFAS